MNAATAKVVRPPAARSLPAARREEVIEAIDGIVFSDPYRWLEEDTPEALAWQAAHSDAARAQLRDWPGFDRLRRALPRFMEYHRLRVPRYAGGLWFQGDADTLHASEILGGNGHVLRPGPVEPEDATPPGFAWYEPSPNGRFIAYGASAGGGLQGSVQLLRLRVLEVASGRDLPLRVPFASTNFAWLPDSSGFYVVAGRAPPTSDPERLLLFHDLTASAPRVEPLRGLGFTTRVQVSPDGCWTAIVTGTREPRADWVLDRRRGSWRAFLAHVPAVCIGLFHGDQYIALTTWNAPCGRIVSIPLASPEDTSSWRDLVPEGKEVIQSIAVAETHLVVSSLEEASSRLRVHDLDGGVMAEVPLPTCGSVATSNTIGWLQTLGMPAVAPDPGGFSYVHQSFSSPPALHRYDLNDGEARALTAPTEQYDHLVDTSERIKGKDGTVVPVNLVYRRDLDLSCPQPTVIYCYGAYNFAMVPGWIGVLGPFVEAGGLVVFAHLRGGGEYGAEWWRAGHHEHKQRSFDDIYSVAEGLITCGLTTADRLGIVGLSNGGTNVCTALLQRPDLFKAGAALAPQCDLVRYCRDPFCGGAPITGFHQGLHINGGTWRDPGWGRDGTPDPGFARRAHFPQSMYPDPFSYSPYHIVRDHLAYPALLAVMGTEDVWCPPWHGRKLIARMQAATASDSPVLLRVWKDAGHDHPLTNVDQVAEWLGFLMRQLGVDPL